MRRKQQSQRLHAQYEWCQETPNWPQTSNQGEYTNQPVESHEWYDSRAVDRPCFCVLQSFYFWQIDTKVKQENGVDGDLSNGYMKERSDGFFRGKDYMDRIGMVYCEERYRDPDDYQNG